MEGRTSSPWLGGETARELDFYRLRGIIAELAVSEEGRAIVLAREPCADSEQISRLKALGREWYAYLASPRPPALIPWQPVQPLFGLLGIDGAQLRQEQAYAVWQFCRAARHTKDALSDARGLGIPHLAALAGEMPDVCGAEDAIAAILTPDGDIRDLPALRAIRSRIAGLHREIENAIRRYTTDSALSQTLQSTVPVWRKERELLAVRADRRGYIRGIIHEVSASGQTVYIEPDEVVRANNDLVQAEFELQAEIRAVLQELTGVLGGYRDALRTAHGILLELDAAHAAARWQKAVNGTFAESCDLQKEPPAIYGARHPLLGSQAVPVDICCMDGKRVLIITGPNTGGKTVTLKTVALFSLLNQAGFPVPAAEGTRLPIFTEVFADIGDGQSIDDSLSTFSGHMKKLADMAAHATRTSLVLLDELGSGTDPQEGGAIAMAVLDALIQRGSFVIATTHHGILKNYGYASPHCINASVAFDDDTLRPTYRLLMGVPGESHAIDIARRSGLPEYIVSAARTYLTTERADVSTLITGLSQKHEELDALLREAGQKSQQLQEKELRLRERDIALREAETAQRETELSHGGQFLRNARSQLENLVRELREGEITRAKTLQVRQFITDISGQVDRERTQLEADRTKLEQDKAAAQREAEVLAANGMRLRAAGGHHGTGKKTRRRRSNAEALAAASAPEPPSSSPPAPRADPGTPRPPRLAPGIEVYAGRERRRGVLLQQLRNGAWMVQFGSLKMSVPQAQLMPAPAGTVPAASYTVESRADTTEDTDRPLFELRLLGMYAEDAMKALERQLDLCAIHGFRSFSIIHGKGAGILQQAVHDYLSHYPGVKEFRFAPPEDGGTGKTYVDLF